MIAATLQLSAFLLVAWGLYRGVDWFYRRGDTGPETPSVALARPEPPVGPGRAVHRGAQGPLDDVTAAPDPRGREPATSGR